MKKVLSVFGSVLALVAALSPVAVLAQDDESGSDESGFLARPALTGRQWYVAPMFSYTLPDHNRGTDNGYGVTLAGGKKLLDGFALEASTFYTMLDAKDGSSTAKLMGGGLAALVFPSTNFPNIYGVLGAYYGSAKNHPGALSSYNGPLIDTGVGFFYPLHLPLLPRSTMLRADARFRLDGHGHNQAGTTAAQGHAFYDDVFNVGLLFPLGPEPQAKAGEPVAIASASPDSDNDGVPDEQDKCPGTPAGAVVDAQGCEKDTDGDGVPDSRDKCPDTMAGIAVDENGCPLDADGDGVPDSRDDCPNTPRGAKVLANGCTLRADCRKPRAGEQVDENGCAVEQKFELRGVKFDFDSDRLTEDAKKVLTDVVGTLQAYPDIDVEVQGHTCNIGTPEYNLGLSDRRARSVKKYLAEHGIAAKRMTTKGYGLTQPVDSNETEQGRENNRRVELKVLNAPEGDKSMEPTPYRPKK